MRSTLFTALAFASAAMAADEVHGESALGNTMGPVGFLWPSSRAWSEDTDNTAPCGSSEGVTERTKFPISMAPIPKGCPGALLTYLSRPGRCLPLHC